MKKRFCIRTVIDSDKIARCLALYTHNTAYVKKLSRILSMAANSRRLHIMLLLYQEKELCPCDLSDILGISVPAVSQHLKKLKDGQIVKTRRVAQTIFYSLKEDHHFIIKPLFKHINSIKS